MPRLPFIIAAIAAFTLLASLAFVANAKAHYNRYTFKTPAATAAMYERRINAEADSRNATCKGGPHHISCVAEAVDDYNIWHKLTFVLHKTTGPNTGYIRICASNQGCQEFKRNNLPD